MRGGASIDIQATPERVYDLLAEVTNMGRWSPECHRCEWLDGSTAATAGARFRGHNRSGLIRWSNVSEIVEAERGRVLAWVMGGPEKRYSEWRYTFEPTERGVRVSETFRSLRHTLLGRLGGLPLGGERRSERRLQAGVEQTLERLRAAAEWSSPDAD
jgi:uncharacterized protein YndB with AHSA1/START domain